MKIICVGRNYAEHAKELGNAIPEKPVLFLKPDTALLKSGEAFYHPDFSQDVHHEAELVLKIGKMGKRIQEKFALGYISEITLGIDFTARDIQAEQKKKGLPWEIAKAFDGSAPIGDFIPFAPDTDYNFFLLKNGDTVQEGNPGMMLFNFAQLISYISGYFTLKTGDLIYTGTPAGVGPVKMGDVLEGFLNGKKVLHTEVK
ncbi:MAG: fumarylacetoacetate hydrolase family protein [Bacteroidetes bacterium]|nr:fumarylacetoacetate hydrolase family protein [Bacteroidota bacterium]